ncbi:uncharacterized protein LOC134243465 [Saccostrea cucullata]|uniref:uncharacterized protein LOC134243465 n=1 Tax=Saccostrea cuccullata TaxID=36930 RepID=UPI002ED51946
MNPVVLVNGILELNCTVFTNSGLNASMLFWEKNGTRLMEDSMIPAGERTLLFKKNITSVEEEGTYTCRSIDSRDISHSSLVVEYDAVRDVTNFSCILYKSRDEFTCTWELGLYHHPAYLNVTARVSMDNGSSWKFCQSNVKGKCTWTSDDGAINSVSKIVILKVENRKYGVIKSFRKDYITRHISNKLTDVDLNTSIVVCGLVPASTYNVKVQIKPLKGLYYSDVTQKLFTTCSREPSKGPSVHSSGYSTDICHDWTSRRKVTVYWKGIPRKYQNGKLTGYTISFQNNTVHLDSERLTGEIEIPCKNSSMLSIKGCNKDGCSLESKILIPPYTDVILPSKVIVEHRNTSCVDVTWFHRGGQVAVDIVWCKRKSGSLQCQGEINFMRLNGTYNFTSISSENIKSEFDDVIFGVAIINIKKISGGIKWQDACSYQKNLEPKKVTGVRLLPDAPENSLVISWSPVLCDASDINNVYVHSYEIIFCRLDSLNHCNGEKKSVEISATSYTQYTLKNLHPNVIHGIWVRAKSLTKVGPISDMVSGIPVNNDLTSGAVVGIIIAGGFVLVVMLAGGVCILRNVRSKLGLGETFPIHMPDLESEKSCEKFLNSPAPYYGNKSQNYISDQTKGCQESSHVESDQYKGRVLKCLTGNLLDNCAQSKGTVFPLIDFRSEKDIEKENDNELDKRNDYDKMSEILDRRSPESCMINLKRKQMSDVIPPGYAKVVSPCLHEAEISVEPRSIKNEESLNDQPNNDESYVTNEPSHWNDESTSKHDAEHQRGSSLFSSLTQSLTSDGNKGISANLTSTTTNNVLGDSNTNLIGESFQKTISSADFNSDDYISNDFLTNVDVHSAPTIDKISIIDINSSAFSQHVASNICDKAEMCPDYVYNDTQPDNATGVKLLIINYGVSQNNSDSENTTGSMEYVSYSGALEGDL